MNRFENILALCDPHDGGAGILARARAVAAPGASITVADVVGVDQGRLDRFVAPLGHGLRVEHTVLARRRTALQTLVHLLRQDGFQADARVYFGRRDRAVIEAVQTSGHDLVLMATQPTTWRPALQGAEQHLVRACTCPVWLLGPAAEHRAARVLAALGPVQADPVRAELNHDILAHAAGLALADGARLDICHVWSAPERAILRAHTDLVPEAAQLQLATQRAMRSRERLDCFVRALPEPHPPLRVLHLEGTPEDILADHVAAEAIDTIVLGTMKTKTHATPAHGGTAETLLSRVTCSVLALKPRAAAHITSKTAQDLAS